MTSVRVLSLVPCSPIAIAKDPTLRNYTIASRFLTAGDVILGKYKVISADPKNSTAHIKDMHTGKEQTLTDIPKRITVSRKD